MNFLSGKKGLIVILMTAVALLVKLITGEDLTQWVHIIVNALGWGQELSNPAIGMVADLVVAAFTTWTAVKTLMKFYREKRAGASMLEAGTPIGAVKLAIANGVIPPVEIVPPAVAEPPRHVVLEQVKALNKDVAGRVS